MTIAELPVPIDQEKIAAFCRQRGIRKMSLFGSVVRPDFDPSRSDIDVLVEFLPGRIPGWEFSYWHEDLEPIFGRKVDLLSTLLTHQIKLRAFERVVQCIGEAVKRLPPSLREAYPAVDWKGAAGLRHWLAHGYDGLDAEVLWKAAHEQLPGLEKTVRQMLADLT